jgi:F-type H+-transporting ATPase subunit b
MNILAQTQLIIANNGSFGINTDILETNAINIVILVIGLVIFVGKTLRERLAQRQTEIINSVEDSEKRLNDATNRLAEAKKQLSQARVIIDEIKKETKATKISLLENDYVQAKKELSRRFNVAATTLKNRERLILSEIKQNISLLALKQVVSTIEKQAGTEFMQESRAYDITELDLMTYMQESIKMVGVANQPAGLK